MISMFNFLLLTTLASSSAASEFSLKGDPCAKYDRCQSKTASKTCSCDKDCHAYGTCCHDVANSKANTPTYKCYDQRIFSPVFAKRSCSVAYRGHLANRLACLDDDIDEMDVRNNLLMISHKTKVTYWNKHCAICNNEAEGDLQYWNIEVFCPKHEDVSRSLIQTNLTFDQERRQWGLMIGDEILNCVVRYAPPLYNSEAKHCTPNMIESCPADYKDGQISSKCSRYYGERKAKNSDLFFRNIHCAICNNVDPKELECPGFSGPGDSAGESDFRDMMEEIFTDGEWLEKQYECSRGFSYDPGREKCRRIDIEVKRVTAPNSSPVLKEESFALMAVLVALLF